MSKAPVPPFLGQVVIFVPREYDAQSLFNGVSEVPAIVVRVWPESPSYQNDEVNLKVQADGPDTPWRTSVPYSEEKVPFSWHLAEMGEEGDEPLARVAGSFFPQI